MAVWPFAPDWSSEYRVTYEYQTEVIQSRSGKEQRIAQRDVPRVTVEYNTLVVEADLRSTMARLAVSQDDVVLMPDWSRPVLLAGPVSAGSSVATVVLKDIWVRVSMGIIFVWYDTTGLTYVTSSIASISGNNITLSSPASVKIPVDALMYRLWQGHLDTSIGMKFAGDRLGEVGVSFSVDPGCEDLCAIPAAVDTYAGRELVTLEPDWSKELSVDFLSNLESLDYGYGRKSFVRPRAFNSRVIKCSYLMTSRTDIYYLLDLFRRSAGQQGEFFMPTFTEDLRLRSDALDGATTLRIVGQETSDLLETSTVYDNIIIYLNDGISLAMAVMSMNSVTDSTGKDSILHISPALPRAIAVTDVDRICWLPVWRFASDQLVIQWQSDSVATIGVSMMTLESLNAET